MFVCIVTVFGFVWLCWFSYFVGWLVGFNLFVCDFSFACLLCVWIWIWICVCLVWVCFVTICVYLPGAVFRVTVFVVWVVCVLLMFVGYLVEFGCFLFCLGYGLWLCFGFLVVGLFWVVLIDLGIWFWLFCVCGWCCRIWFCFLGG